ncbi:hypothetical protein ORN12_02985 [Pantoea vagans]|uniref:hypothetical protein n=1 Tax=Pantoea vagans TaxID=470934 RepID=UPI00225A7ECD|nr:hypothetical protein [Pantoea vagans]MCX3307976.1 hypothetical protein [Pantoea vagans]
MSSNKDYQKAVKHLSDYRALASECADQHLDLVKKVLNSVDEIYAKEFDDLTEMEKGKLDLFRQLFPSVKDSIDAIDKYNKSLKSDYSEGMTLISNICGANKYGN